MEVGRGKVPPKHKNFNKTLPFCVCKSFSRYKDKDCMTDVTFIRSIPVLLAEENLYRRYFSLVACNARKGIRHMTSDFDVCEVDLDMQMSFLNAAPFWWLQCSVRYGSSLPSSWHLGLRQCLSVDN